VNNRLLRGIDLDKLDHKTWATVDDSKLSEPARARFIKYRDAIVALIDGAPRSAVIAQHGVARSPLRRALIRCVKNHRDGRVWGFRALLRFVRIEPYRCNWQNPSTKPKGANGQFRHLMDRFPEIEELVVALFLKKTELIKAHDAKIPVKALHRIFLKRLREAGVEEKEYPFNTLYCGYRAMGRFLKDVFKKNLSKGVKARVHPDAAQQLKDGAVVPPKEPPPPTMFRIIGDGHRIDAMMQVELPSPQTGEMVSLLIERPWLLLFMDAGSRAILGYVLCLRREYNEDDVLEALEKTFGPWRPMELTIPGLSYNPGAGLPSGVIDRMAFATASQYWVDNNKAGLSKHVRDRVKTVTGSAINAGPVAMPERRALIERLFGTLARSGFQRLPSTTGSNPKDGRRKNPEEAVRRFDIKLTEIEEVLDVLIANYNADIHGSLHGRSPLEHIRHYLENGGRVTQIPESKRSSVDLFVRKESVTIRGNLKQGKSPYITFAGVTYRNQVLAHSPDLIGVKITIDVNIRDVRCLKAYFPNGAELGVLTAHGHWGVTPHDLRMRRAIMSLKNKGLIQYLHSEDPVQTYLDYLNTKAQTKKRERGKLVQIKRKMAAARPVTPNEHPSGADGPTLVVVSHRDKDEAPVGTPRRAVIY